MCPPGWQLGCGSSPGFSLTPPNLDWAGKSPPVPPEPLHLLYPVFCPSPSGIVRFSCVAAARGAQDSHARSCGTQPGPDAIQAVCPPLCIPNSRSLAFSLAGISLRSATPWQAPAEVTGAAGCRNPADPGRARIPPNRARSLTRHRGTGRSSAPTGRSSRAGATGKQNSSLCPSPLFCWKHFGDQL